MTRTELEGSIECHLDMLMEPELQRDIGCDNNGARDMSQRVMRIIARCVELDAANKQNGRLETTTKQLGRMLRNALDEVSELRRHIRSRLIDLLAYIQIQKNWSLRTFGPDRQEGICKHIEKELAEIRQAPMDLMEWVDVVILALDGAWRTGATPDQIAEALIEKQRINLKRTWGPQTGSDQPIEHIRDEPEAFNERTVEDGPYAPCVGISQ